MEETVKGSADWGTVGGNSTSPPPTGVNVGQSVEAKPATPVQPAPNGTVAGSNDWSPVTKDSINAAQANTPESNEPGLVSRTYETSGAKGIVDLAKAEAFRPVDLYHQAIDAYNKGDWKEATSTAFKLIHLMPDKEDPLVQAALRIVMQPVEQLKENQKIKHEAGLTGVKAALTPTAAVVAKNTYDKAKQHYSEGHTAAAVGDVVSGTGEALASVDSLVGGIVKSITDKAGVDITNKNWGALAGDALGPLLTLGAGKLLGKLGEFGESPTTGAVSGDVTANTVRPGVSKIAGVDVPVSTQSVAEPSATSNVIRQGATAQGAQKFIEEQTQPAAVKATVSNVGQSAMDSIDEIRTLRNEPLTAQKPPVIKSVDDAAKALQEAAKPTYKTLDDAVQPEIQAWERDKEAFDQQNPKPVKPVEGPAPTTGTPKTAAEKAVQKAQFKEQVNSWQKAQDDWLEDNPEPKTFTKLQDQITQAERTVDSEYSPQVDKESAIKSLPKFRQEMEDFLDKHADKVDPDELHSANKLWAQSKQYEWLADKVRSATSGTTGTASTLKQQPLRLNPDSLKNIPNMFDNRYGAGAFEKTLGPQGVENYNNILNALRNPISGQIPFDIFIRDHALGTLIRSASLTGPIANNILFNPELGTALLRLWKATARTAAKTGIPAVTGAKAGMVIPKPYSFGPENPDQVKRTAYSNASGLTN